MSEFVYDFVYNHSTDKENIHLRKSEILRYMGQISSSDNRSEELIDHFVPKICEVIVPRGAFVTKKIEHISKGIVKAGDIIIESDNLSKNLEGCDSAVIFALTIGSNIDRMIMTQSRISALRGLTVSAIATEATEAYADLWCNEIGRVYADQSLYLRPRFSPGYGDFDLRHQKDIERLLNTPVRCGICVTDTFILTPTKSVTGIVGLCEKKEECVPGGCELCQKADCMFRKSSGGSEHRKEK